MFIIVVINLSTNLFERKLRLAFPLECVCKISSPPSCFQSLDSNTNMGTV